jgi:hypothetical protein
MTHGEKQLFWGFLDHVVMGSDLLFDKCVTFLKVIGPFYNLGVGKDFM